MIKFDETGTLIDPLTGLPARLRNEYKAMKFSDFVNVEFPEPEYVIDPWLPMRGICMLFAKAGLGKTWTALDVALSAAGGRPALDHWKVPQTRRVLYIDGEMDGAEFRDRALTLARAKGITANIPLTIMGLSLQSEGMPMIDDALHQESIDAECQKADLIIVDNLSSLTRMPENEGESWIPVQQWALRMRAQGKAVLFIHHAGKGGDQRGTSRREDVMNTVIILKAVEDADDQRTVFDWHFKKNRGFNGDAVAARRVELFDHQETGLVSWDVQKLSDIERDDLADLIRDGMTYQDIATELGINKSTVSRRAKALVESGRISAEELPKHGSRRHR